MFKLMKSELYDDFHCIMDECPENCCDESWQITVDEAAYEKYRALGIADLDSKITPDVPHVLLRDPATGRCPFITENGLCTIHATRGEEYLSETCRSYPRFATDYGPLVTLTLGSSCPPVAAALLHLDHLFRLKEEVLYENKREKGRPYLVTNAEKRMKACLSVFGKPDAAEDCLRECLSVLGSEKALPEPAADEAALPDTVLEKYPLLEKNLAMSYLFEHLLLETKNASPDYGSVVCKCAEILHALRRNLAEAMREEADAEEETVVRVLYRTMRLLDHETASG